MTIDGERDQKPDHVSRLKHGTQSDTSGSAPPRLSAVHKNALRIVAMMDEQATSTIMPATLARELTRKGLLAIVVDKWHEQSFGLEFRVCFTKRGRAVAKMLAQRTGARR